MLALKIVYLLAYQSRHFSPHSEENVRDVFGERLFAVKFCDVRNDTEERLQLHQPFGDLKENRLVFQEETFLQKDWKHA